MNLDELPEIPNPSGESWYYSENSPYAQKVLSPRNNIITERSGKLLTLRNWSKQEVRVEALDKTVGNI